MLFLGGVCSTVYPKSPVIFAQIHNYETTPGSRYRATARERDPPNEIRYRAYPLSSWIRNRAVLNLT